jgi:hypothetical protein
MKRSDQIGLIALLEGAPGLLAGKPLIGHIRPLSRQTGTEQTWLRAVPGRQQACGQMLIMRAGTSKAETGNHSLDGDTQQEMKAARTTQRDCSNRYRLALPASPGRAAWRHESRQQCCQGLHRPFLARAASGQGTAQRP